MTVERVQLIQKNIDLLVERITDNQIKQAAENVKIELRQILATETQGTGQLAESLQVQRGTQRGKPTIRILSARHGLALFRGSHLPYINLPPGGDSRFRFVTWAQNHNWNPKRLAFIIGTGRSRGKVYSDRSDMLIRALRAGFRSFRR